MDVQSPLDAARILRNYSPALLRYILETETERETRSCTFCPVPALAPLFLPLCKSVVPLPGKKGGRTGEIRNFELS